METVKKLPLRSLDNALPSSLERPKKIAKLGGTLEEPKKTDDNTMLEKQMTYSDQAIEYISSEDLKPFSDPESNFRSLMEKLESKNWTEICEGLNDVRRLAIFHSSLLLPILDKVVLVLIKAMKNPRSALCKTSIMASTEIFKAYSPVLLSSSSTDSFDNLILQLLLKASQDKKFVCDEAEGSLRTVALVASPHLLLNKLQPYIHHNNPKVRAKAAITTSNCVANMGGEMMKEYGFSLLLKTAADLLNDRLPEAREAARCIANSIHSVYCLTEVVSKHGDDDGDQFSVAESWKKFCSANLSPISAQAIEKTINHQ